MRKLLVAAAVVAVVAAGCGGSSSEDASETSAESATQAAEAATTEAADTETAAAPEPDDELLVSPAGWNTDFTKHSVPLSEFQSGGPPPDGIPALDEPAFVSVSEADEWLSDEEPVIALELGGEARAYPLQILIWHEIVNDTLAGTPIAVTFCPLCYTTIVFDRRLEGMVLDFGTSGNLRNSDLVMYDRQTESWWQQFGGEAVVGELTGARLEQLPARILAWSEFATAHPDGSVLSRETGFDRNYGQNPYTGYDDVDSPPFFPAENLDDERLPPKERVVYIEQGDEAVAVPFSVLEDRKKLEVELAGQRLELEFIPGVRSSLDDATIEEGREVGSVSVRSLPAGEPVAFDTPFWFAVAAFRPDVRVIT